MKKIHFLTTSLLALSAVTAGAYAQTASQDEDAIMDEIVVIGEANRAAATVATRTETEALATPYSIISLPGRIIEESASVSLSDALRYSGITGGTDNFGNAGEFFSSRGFQLAAGSNYFRDGLRYRKYGQVPLYDIDRIEVLRGPASILYGALEPGGVVNIVSRSPEAERQTKLRLRAGDNNYRQAVLDTTGGITEAVNYRLQGLYEDADSFKDAVSNTSKGVNGVVDFQVRPETLITARASWFEDQRTGDRGTVLAYQDGGRFQNAAGRTYDFADVPRSRFLGEKFGENYFRDINISLSARHELNENWAIRADIVRSEQKEERAYIWADPVGQIVGDDGLLNRVIGDWNTDLEGSLGRLELVGEFSLGSTRHKILIGGEYERFENDRTNERYAITPINIYNPVYLDGRPENGPRIMNSPYGALFKSKGFYIQDVVELTEQFIVLAGIRYDEITDTNTLNGAVRQTADGWTPQLGLVWRPTPYISPYVSYTRSFVPQSGTDRFGNAFDPQKGEQYELGLKLDVRPAKAIVTAALFRLDRENLTVNDVGYEPFQRLSGLQRSEGIELTVAAEPIDGLRLNLNYNHLFKAEFVNDNQNAGNTIPNAPENAVGLFASYDLPGAWSSVSVNGGLTYVGKRYGIANNSFYLPDYTLTDVGVRYRFDEAVEFSLNVRNLFDETYYTNAINSTTVGVGQPRTLMAGVGLTF